MSPVFRHGRLRLYLLRLLDEEPRHGYEVIRLLRDRFMGVYAPSPGTIYPRLARLEEEGLVTHDEENGRKVYRITEAGREELRNRGDELDELEEELSASVSDIVREVREDVRETVRNLREELTWAAREVRRTERESREDAGRQRPRGGQGCRPRAGEAGQGGRVGAGPAGPRRGAASARPGKAGARRGAQAVPSGCAKGPRPCATTPGRVSAPRGNRRQAEHPGPEGSESGEGAGHPHGAHDWGSWLGWGDWGRWSDWPGRRSWPGPKDMGAFRDLERLARDFATDLRKVAWESGALGGDVLTDLRSILEETLDRIRAEVFGRAPGARLGSRAARLPGEPAA